MRPTIIFYNTHFHRFIIFQINLNSSGEYTSWTRMWYSSRKRKPEYIIRMYMVIALSRLQFELDVKARLTATAIHKQCLDQCIEIKRLAIKTITDKQFLCVCRVRIGRFQNDKILEIRCWSPIGPWKINERRYYSRIKLNKDPVFRRLCTVFLTVRYSLSFPTHVYHFRSGRAFATKK